MNQVNEKQFSKFKFDCALHRIGNWLVALKTLAQEMTTMFRILNVERSACLHCSTFDLRFMNWHSNFEYRNFEDERIFLWTNYYNNPLNVSYCVDCYSRKTILFIYWMKRVRWCSASMNYGEYYVINLLSHYSFCIFVQWTLQ